MEEILFLKSESDPSYKEDYIVINCDTGRNPLNEFIDLGKVTTIEIYELGVVFNFIYGTKKELELREIDIEEDKRYRKELKEKMGEKEALKYILNHHISLYKPSPTYDSLVKYLRKRFKPMEIKDDEINKGERQDYQ